MVVSPILDALYHGRRDEAERLLAERGTDTLTVHEAAAMGVVARLETLLGPKPESIYLSPVTRDRDVALSWLKEYRGTGLDGIVAKRVESIYKPGERAMIKVKEQRTADCVVGGFRWGNDGKRERNRARHLLALPAYDQCIKASHVFNLLDARGVISVTERQSYILRVRELAKACGQGWLATEGGGNTV